MALREFNDASGVLWRAWDTHPSPRSVSSKALAETLRNGWLTFECHVEKRRYAPIPKDWEFLSDEVLRRLLFMAEPASRLVP